MVTQQLEKCVCLLFEHEDQSQEYSTFAHLSFIHSSYSMQSEDFFFSKQLR